MRKLLRKIITLFTFLLFFLFLLDFGFSATACTANTQACKECNEVGDNKEQCIKDVNKASQEHSRPTDSNSEGNTQSSNGGNQGSSQNRLGDIYDELKFPPTHGSYKQELEQEKNAHLFCLTSDTCYYDEDTKKFKLNDFAIDTPLSVPEINARAELDRMVNLYCTPGTSSYNPDICNTQLEDITGLNSGKWWEASDQDRAQSHLIGDRWGWFWYLFQGEDAAATFTLNKYGVDWGVSEEQLEWASEPIISKVCINNNDLELEDLGVSFENEIDDIVEGESLFDFRGSVTNLIPIDEDLIEGEGYVKYSYYFKKPEKSAIGDFDDEELQTLSKRNIAVVLFYNKMNRSDDDPDDFDVYGYYEVISDPDVIELNSENPIVSSGIQLVYVDEVYLNNSNFRIAFYYRDYFEVESGEKKQENLRIWTSSSSLPNAMVIPEQIKSLVDTTGSSTDNSINEEGQTSSGSGSSNEIEDDFLSGLS